MKIIYIKRKALYVILVILLILFVSLILYTTLINKTIETFKKDVYYKGTLDQKVIAFTCNVDWGNEYIKPMLEIFKDENIHITFFVTGKWAEKNPELLKEIASYGHEIGNHGYMHRDYEKLSYELNKDEISKCHSIVYDILGIDCKYFAPPSGSYNDNTIKAATNLNYDVIMWSIDTIDWRKDSTKDIIVKRVLDKAQNSAIVLMHPTEETIKALPVIIDSLSREGYTIGSVSDVFR